MTTMRLRRTDSGSVTIEAVMIAPVIILLVTVAVVLGRIATFHEVVRQGSRPRREPDR